jgi:hypothetical protein
MRDLASHACATTPTFPSLLFPTFNLYRIGGTKGAPFLSIICTSPPWRLGHTNHCCLWNLALSAPATSSIPSSINHQLTTFHLSCLRFQVRVISVLPSSDSAPSITMYQLLCIMVHFFVCSVAYTHSAAVCTRDSIAASLPLLCCS